MRKSISLYFKYISVILQSSMQYKLSFILMLIGRFFVTFSSFLGIYFIFSSFTDIKGYSYGDVLLCFSILQLSFYLAECFANGFAAFSGLVIRGDFDRILLRPCSPILQVLGTKFDLSRVGQMISSIIMLIMGIRSSQVQWTAGRVMTAVLMVAGGILLFSGLFMIGAAICFFSLEDPRCINMLTYGACEHGKYPIDVYGKGLMKFCTYIIPYTLIQYYPLQYVLGRTDNWLYALCPTGIVLFLLLCYGFWRFGMGHYTSSGS